QHLPGRGGAAWRGCRCDGGSGTGVAKGGGEGVARDRSPSLLYQEMSDIVPSTPNTQPPTPNTLSYSLLAVVLFAIAARLYLLITTHRTVEDFFITLRYAENIAHGAGFVYNAGERVLGTTTPLYTLYLALTSWLGLPAPLW